MARQIPLSTEGTLAHNGLSHGMLDYQSQTNETAPRFLNHADDRQKVPSLQLHLAQLS